MASITTPRVHDQAASVLHIWRSADEAIQTDPTLARRQAYARAVDAIGAQMPSFTDVDELIAYYWSGRMQASAALASISQQGYVLNYQVIAAAACWQALPQVMRAA